tara:strand:+ start:28374 stop:31640 length:3267 start_codon:yes stop_codon:yes gene_type:complete
MTLMKKFSLSAATLALLAAAPAAVYAQDTASSLRGTITDAAGAPVANATVTILHTASGTASTATTGDTGSFYQSGLRVGGPYTLYVSAPGFEGDVIDGLFLRPGSQSPLQIALSSATTDVITVTGVAINTLDLNNGAGSSYSARDIANQPATSRDVLRTLARDPIAIVGGGGSLSVAGSNPRFNALAIDGSLQQDDFGLSSSTYATSRSPINLDAIEAASVAASDYSVTVGSFTGGLVNVVTRSGTNEIDGSAFYYRSDEDFVGNSSNGSYVATAPFTEEEYGITVGGPIIRDRLFFFGSYDRFESGSSANFTSSDATNYIDPAYFSVLANLVQTNLGIDIGDRPTTVSLPVTSERYLAKVDWNINDDHRLSFTYQQTEEAGTSNVGSTTFSSAYYDTPTELTAYTVQLFSDWTPNLSTTLRINQKDLTRGQICHAGSDQPQVQFVFDGNGLAGTALDGFLNHPDAGRDFTFTGGCDRYRHANEYDDSRLQIFGSADYNWGDHVFTVGGEFEQFDLRNLFISDSNGSFRYTSVDQILTNSPNRVDYQNVPSNDTASGATTLSSDRFVFFAQDTWQLRDNLSVNYGFRYETYSQDDAPAADTAMEANYGISSTTNLDGLDLFLPRASVRWEPFARTTVTAGVGRFAGGSPWVWISNAFQQSTVFTSGSGFTNLPDMSVPASLIANVAALTPGRIDLIDPNFELPVDTKASIRVDQEFDMNFGFINLGTDYRATFQYLFTNSDTSFGWRNLAQTDLAASQPTGVAPDGRTIYADLQDLGLANATELTNFTGGDSQVFSVSLGKDYDNGLGFQIGYAYQDVTAVTEGSSSRGISSWRGILSADRNNPENRTSYYQIEDRFTVNVNYATQIFGELETRFDLFGDITSGSPFTYTYDVSSSNALFGRAGSGESPYDNSPIYVPTGPADANVVYAAGFDQTGFFDYVASHDLAAGQIDAPYSHQSGWNQQWDLRIQQDLPGIPGASRFVGDNRLKLVIDVQNFMNMLNDEWGTQTNGASNGQLAIVRADLVSAADVALNGVDAATALTGDDPRTTCLTAGDCVYRYNAFTNQPTSFDSTGSSLYRIRVGIRYEF